MKKVTITEEQFEQLTAATAAYKAKLEEEKIEDERKLAEIERKMKVKERRKEKAATFFKIFGLIMLFCIVLPAMITMYGYTSICTIVSGIAWIGIVQMVYVGICAVSWLVAMIIIITRGLADLY